MLLSFEFSNYGSVKENQGISFVASSIKDEGVDLIKNKAIDKQQYLPTLLIYGPNASGKSNVIQAFSKMLTFIKRSHRSGEPGGDISRNYFLLDDKYKKLPTEFEINFIFEETHYSYGFEIDNTDVLSEWLYSYPQKRARKLFERKKGDFSFGRTLKGPNKTIEDVTRNNSLFLSAAIQNNHEQLTNIAHYFSKISIETSLALGGAQAESRIGQEQNWEIKKEVVEFLRTKGTGISDYILPRLN